MATPLPSAFELRKMLEQLLGRDVEVKVSAGAVSPYKHPGAVVGAYVDDADVLRALMVADLDLTVAAAAAIALMGVKVVQDVMKSGLLTPALYENAAEIINVAVSLFNLENAPHVRLRDVYAPREILPPDVENCVLAVAPRLDMEVTISGYGSGRVSVVIV